MYMFFQFHVSYVGIPLYTSPLNISPHYGYSTYHIPFFAHLETLHTLILCTNTSHTTLTHTHRQTHTHTHNTHIHMIPPQTMYIIFTPHPLYILMFIPFTHVFHIIIIYSSFVCTNLPLQAFSMHIHFHLSLVNPVLLAAPSTF